jgi:hypothetical protein
VSVKYKWTTAAWNQMFYSPLLVLSRSLYWKDGGLSLGANVYWQSGGGDHGTFDLQYPVYDANSASGVRWVGVDSYPFTRAATENQWQQFAMTWRNGSTDDAVSTVASDGWLHVYWNGTLIYDLNNIPLLMNEDTASAPEGKPNRLRTLWLGYYGLFGPATNIVLTDPSDSWSSIRKVPYFGYYDIEVGEWGFNYINEVSGSANLAVMSPDTTVYNTTIGDQYDSAGMKLIAYLNITELRLNDPFGINSNPDSFQNYLNDVYDELNNAHILDNVIAFVPGEEWNTGVTDGYPAGWQTFSVLNEQTVGNLCDPEHPDGSMCWRKARRDLMVSKLANVIAAIKTKFPGKAVLGVDTFWDDEYNPNDANAYHPAPRNLDMLGLDAYMGGQHVGYTTDCNATMQQKFADDVVSKYNLALTKYWQPILIIGQAFESGSHPFEPGNGDGWPMPSNCQLNWWYSLAQSHSRFFGLAWFAYGPDGSQPAAVPDYAKGVRYYPDQKSWLRDMYLHNQSIQQGPPDMLAPGQSLAQNELLTSSDGRFHLAYQGDGNLVLYNSSWEPIWSSGTNDNNPGQAVMQGDGNFVIYNGNGAPVWWTATEYSPGAYLVVQSDGNLVVYTAGAPNAAIWNSETCCQ